MRGLLAHAAQLGVAVHIAHLPEPYRGYYHHAENVVVIDFKLTPVERRDVLAHELGHAYYGHQCEDVPAQEDAADIYAARLLVDPARYAELERQELPVDAIAEELDVTEECVAVFQRHVLTRLRGVTYAAARMGRAQYRHAWN